MLRALHGGLPEILRDEWRTGDQRYYVSDTRRFKLAGWTPRHSVHQGVRRLYEWLSNSMDLPQHPSVGGFGKEIYPGSGVEAI